MSDNKNDSKAISILGQIKAEREKAMLSGVKQELGKLFDDYIKAQEVVKGIEKKIFEVAKKAGDQNLDIKAIFSDE